MKILDFVADEQYKNLLIRDFNELQICVDNNASKSVLILSGSIIEAVLLEFFSHNLPQGVSKTNLLKMSLAELISKAEEIDLISSKSKELSTVIKNYRNLIHPGREVRTNEKFDYETAIVSFNLVKIILKEIRENYIQKYGYTAEDIFNKINLDSSTYSIYEKLLLKLNEYEKNKLLNQLIEQEVEDYSVKEYSDLYRYIKILKKQVSDEIIRNHCTQLLREVEKGKEINILAKFEIFGDNLNLLNNEEQDLILSYIYNKANSISAWNKIIEESRFRKLFSFLGLYLYSPNIKQYFFDLLKKIVKSHGYTDNAKWYYTIAYNNMLDPLSETQKEKCKQFIIESFPIEESLCFFTALEEDNLPF